jgi:hypothetical protein
MPKEGDLRVWWIPQVPMQAFYVPVKNIDEAILVLDTLAKYDIFQFENVCFHYGFRSFLQKDKYNEWRRAFGLL